LISVGETMPLVCAWSRSNRARRLLSVLLVSFGNSGRIGEIGDASPNRSIY
jgi:hypothetical protein